MNLSLVLSKETGGLCVSVAHCGAKELCGETLRSLRLNKKSYRGCSNEVEVVRAIANC